jgi:hypothetical protein
VTAVLNKLTFEIDPARDDAGSPPALERVLFPNVPTVDGCKPRTWDYAFDLHIGGGIAVLRTSPSSIAFRAANCTTGLHTLGPNEELVMVAATGGLTLTASREIPRVSADIIAAFSLRKI